MSKKASSQHEFVVLNNIRDGISSLIETLPTPACPEPPTQDFPAFSHKVRDLLDGDALIETIDTYAELFDGLDLGAEGNYRQICERQATEIGLTPVEYKKVNLAIDNINLTVNALSLTGFPLSTNRADVSLYLASVVAYRPALPVAFAGLGILWRLLQLLWKLLKWLHNGRKHVDKIRQAQRLRAAGKLSAEAAKNIIRARLAALAALIASIIADIAAAKELIAKLRQQGRNEEADELEERVRQMQERLDELERQHDELKQQEGD